MPASVSLSIPVIAELAETLDVASRCPLESTICRLLGALDADRFDAVIGRFDVLGLGPGLGEGVDAVGECGQVGHEGLFFGLFMRSPTRRRTALRVRTSSGAVRSAASRVR